MLTLLYIVLYVATPAYGGAPAGSDVTPCPGTPYADCDAPFITEAYATGPHSIYVAWQDLFGNPENTYALAVLPEGTQPVGAPTYPGIPGQSFVAEGLAPGTTYDIYVQTECPGDTSNWYGPVQRTTDIINGEACQIALDITDNNCPDVQDFPIHVDINENWLLGDEVFLKYVDIILQHPWLADLSLTLISPSGVEVDLSSDNGVGAQNFGDPSDMTCTNTLQFADFACVSVTDIEDDFTGQVMPEQPLSTVFDGTPAAGVWTLRVCDKASDDIGNLRYIYLAFGANGCTLPPELFVVDEADTSIGVSIATSGTCDSVQIVYGLPGMDPDTEGIVQIVPCGDSLITLTNLQPGTEYEVFARSLCAADSSEWTCATPFSTTCAGPTLASSFDNQMLCATACAEPCALEDSIWQNSGEDDTDWIVFTGSTPTGFTGPSDTRNGIGNYLYMESSGLNCGDTTVAILQSSCLTIGGEDGSCDLGFWYHMYGAGIGLLKCEASTDGGFSWQTLWERSGDQGDTWHFTLIDLSALDGQLAAFRFVATREINFLSDFAIDDIVFYGSTVTDSTAMQYYADNDGDTFGDPAQPVCYCTTNAPVGTSDNALDCDDDDPQVHPAMPEAPCNLVDDNCNGVTDEGMDPHPLDYSVVEVTDATCTGIDDGIIEIAANSGTAPYRFQWSNGDTTNRIESLAPDSYTATVTDFNGCAVVTEAIAIEQTELLAYFFLNMTPPSCPGVDDGSIQGALQGGTGPYTYLWSNGDTTAQAENIGVGAYTVTVTDANGCFAISDTIAVNAAPTFQVSIIQMENVDCHGEETGAIRVQVSNAELPVTYVWSNGDTTALADSLGAGSYNCTVTDSEGCTVVVPGVHITQPESISITVDAVEPPVCAEEKAGTIQLSVDGGTPPYFFQWSNGMFSEDLVNIPSGTYSVTVTDIHACQAFYSNITLQSPSMLDLMIDTIHGTRCPAGTDGVIVVDVDGGSPPYQYQWSTGATTPDTLQNITSGEYALTVSDAFGCKAVIRDLVVESMIEPLEINTLELQHIDCNGDDSGVVTVEVIGGTPPFSYNWSIGIEHTSFADTDSITGIFAGLYGVTVTDAHGCVGTSGLVTLSQPVALSFQLDTIVDITCFGVSTGAVLLDPFGGTAPYTYLWNTSEMSQDLTGVPAGSYKVTIEDAVGCTLITQPFKILQPDSVYLTFATGASMGAPDGWAEVTVTGGFPPYTYQWDAAAAGQSEKRAVDLPPGVYGVTATDGRDCMYSDTVRVPLVNATSGPRQSSFRIFPNPASDHFYIQGSPSSGEVVLWDIAGRQFHVEVERTAGDTHRCEVRGDMAAGIYWVQIGDVITARRIVIQGR